MELSLMADKVILKIADRQGYSPDQVTNTITLGALLRAVEGAVENFGEDALVVLDNGDRYGATYGGLSEWEDLFENVPDDDDER
jgi:hypothetical protein